jgi:hypothetical protein
MTVLKTVFFYHKKPTRARCSSVVHFSSSEHGHVRLLPRFFYFEKNKYIYKKGIGNAHPALCSTFLQTSYSTIASWASTIPLIYLSWLIPVVVREVRRLSTGVLPML